MAKIVLGIGTSQSSLSCLEPALWAQQGTNDMARKDIYRPDGTNITYEQLRAEAGDDYADIYTLEQFTKLHAAAKVAMDRLADDLVAAKPDVLVVIADDHAELMETNNYPAVSIYRGKELVTYRAPLPPEAPEWQHNREALAIIKSDRQYPGAPEFADELIGRLTDKEIDVASVSEPTAPYKGIGHAYAFIANRLLAGQSIPMVPLMLNVWYPPNVPTPSRCYKIGQALRAAIEESPTDLRVAVLAAGGMSHAFLDQDLDRKLMAALRDNDPDYLTSIPVEMLRAGTGQLRDWIALGGAIAGLKCQWMEYLPAYRTPAGSGIGLGYASWS